MYLKQSFKVYRTAVFATLRNMGGNNLSLIAAGVGFFSMLSLFPALAALIALLSLIADPEVVIVQLEEMRELMPDDVFDILHAQIVGLVNTSSDTLGWTGAASIAVALWSARAGVGAMMHGMNVVYHNNGRATWRHYLRALMLTLALIFVGIVALLAVVIAPVVLAFLELGAFTSIAIDVVRWTLAALVVFAGIGLLYRFGPYREHKMKSLLTPGSLFAVVSLTGLSLAFSYYVTHFGNYNEVYGSIGAVIAMLVWLWLGSFLVLLGASLNAEIEAQMFPTPDKPLGDDPELDKPAGSVPEESSDSPVA
jgi:membrane protein